MILQDDERRQVARELHEGFGQDLAAAKMMVDRIDLRDDVIESSEKARIAASSLMEGIIEKIRSISSAPLLDVATNRSENTGAELEAMTQRAEDLGGELRLGE